MGTSASASPTRSARSTGEASRADEVSALWGSRSGRLGDLLPEAAPFFRAERWRGPVTLEAGFAVLVVVAGAGTLTPGDGTPLGLRAGDTLVAPASAGVLEVRGDGVEVIVCRPPRPRDAQGRRTD